MKLLAKLFLGFVLLVVLVAAGTWIYLRQSLPRIEGDAAAPGALAPIEIVRDVDGVPHIFAKSERDGWFAMGYAHAQDRLWQMEFQRRVSSGRLSEVLGERAFDTDRLFRTLGIARMADRIVARLDADTRGNLDAYAAGVNAFLATDPVLPIEFQVFRLKPSPWKPADTMGWLLIMAWDLSANWRTELARLRLATALGPERAGDLMPPYPGDPPVALPDFKAMYPAAEKLALALAEKYPLREDSAASNSWVVSGAFSESGKPLLANDPHLGLQAPALWYLAHVSTPQGSVVGATLPGVPMIAIGRNDNVAWTLTAANGDTQDLFVERLAKGDAQSYDTPTGTAKFEVREEIIRVGSEERRIQVRSTRHGPVISDVVAPAQRASPAGYVIALAWTALSEDNVTLRACFAMNRARSDGELISALRDFRAPQLGVVFADREGHFGMMAPAAIPVRRADNEARGTVPVPGWDAKYDWQGLLPFAQQPALFDPSTGRIVQANHKITPSGYKPFIAVDWFAPYRADRIDELLSAKPKHSLDSFARMQADTLSRLARDLLPAALAAKPLTEEGKRVQSLLTGWNGDMAMDAAAPLAFSGWYRELTRLVYADEMGDLFKDSWDLRGQFMMSVMKAEGGKERWCDDVRTPEAESCATQAARAFDLAAVDLARRYGAQERWRWGIAHSAASDHRPFGFVPYIGRFFNVAPQTAGDSFTVNVGSFTIRDDERPFANRHAASLRAIYDLADLERSRFMQSTGQSGNPLSAWYSSFGERWARVEYITIPTSRDAITGPRVLTLKP